MARRDRTTGLPRRNPRGPKDSREKRPWWNQTTQRIVLLGVPGLVLFVLLGFGGWRWYQDNYVRPDHVIVRVEQREATLGYLADRLRHFALENPGSSGTLEQALFQKIEEELLTLELADEMGIAVTEEEVNVTMAENLDVEYSDERGSPFDTALRSFLEATGISADNYERVVTAQTADRLIRAELQEELGTTGETFSFRFFRTTSEESATEGFERIQEGESFDAVADELAPLPTPTPTPTPAATEPPEDGATPDAEATPTPEDPEAEDREGEEEEPQDRRLREDAILQELPESFREPLAEAEEGDLVGPVQVGSEWFIILLVERNPEAELSEPQLDFLVGERFDEAIAELRTEVTIQRSFDTDDIAWARDHA